MEQQETRPLTIEDSADPKTNAFYHRCETLGQSKAYAVCLHLIRQREKGPLGELYSECCTAIRKTNCPAIAMRDREIAAGKPLYFIGRLSQELVKISDEATLLISGMGRRAGPQKPHSDTAAAPAQHSYAPKHQSPVSDGIDQTSYADVLNSVIKEKAAEAKKEVAANPVSEKPSSSESPLQMARRIMQQAQQRKEQQ